MKIKQQLLLVLFFAFANNLLAQQITGYWHGKIGGGLKGKKVDLKLVIKGDSIVGTSYYYESKNNYKRYSVKGYFDPRTNAVIWWDDMLLDSKAPKFKVFSPGETEMLMEADFNCPGGGKMMLDGTSKKKNSSNNGEKIHLDKVASTGFDDEWNYIIDNWTSGGSDLALIDSIQHIAFNTTTTDPIVEHPTTTLPNVQPEVVLNLPVKKEQTETVIEKPIAKENKPIEFLDLNKPNKKIDTTTVAINTPIFIADTTNNTIADTIERPILAKLPNDKVKVVDSLKTDIPQRKTNDLAITISPTVIEQKFIKTEKVVLVTLPIADSITLNFYDNAEVDGDSISLFLNNTLLIEHIRLSDKPYIVKLNKEQLQTAVELTMVAENLGAIPPNTSYMVAYINGKKYNATLSSTEQTSAVIRFKKKE